MAQASEAAEKLKFLSFRDTLRAEESLLLLTLDPREIPHIVRNDKIAYYFRSLFRLRVLSHARTKTRRLKPTPLETNWPAGGTRLARRDSPDRLLLPRYIAGR